MIIWRNTAFRLCIGILLEIVGVQLHSTQAQTGGARVMVIGDDRVLMRRWSDKSWDLDQLAHMREEALLDAYRKGFAAAYFSADSVGDSILLHLHLGHAYRWASLRMDEESEQYLRKSGVNANRLSRKTFSMRRLGAGMEKTLRYLEDRGFPFAEVRLDSVVLEQETIEARLVVDPGPLTRFDSLIVQGNLEVREAYLASYLGIKEGGLYSESAVKASVEALEMIPFLSVVQPTQVRFHEDKTKVYLALNPAKASRFDGILGFLPDPATGRLLLTGDVSLHLENALKQGEELDVNWRKLQTNTQDLQVKAVLPFVLNSPLTPDALLKIYRRDTLFTDVFAQAGVRFVFRGLNYVRVFADRQLTTLNSTAQYEFITTPPAYLDRRVTSTGLGLYLQRLDNRLNPGKGYRLSAEGAVGNKVIVRNANIPAIVYEQLALQSLQARLVIDAAYYWSIVPRLVWHQQAIAGSLQNGQLFNNEAWRIGGLKTLRGFNEESIFATAYCILRNELRYQLDRSSYVFLLADGAWYENQSVNRLGARRDLPRALGLGISFGTRAGIFSLSYAVGQELGNPVDLRAAKIHFGFISLF